MAIYLPHHPSAPPPHHPSAPPPWKGKLTPLTVPRRNEVWETSRATGGQVKVGGGGGRDFSKFAPTGDQAAYSDRGNPAPGPPWTGELGLSEEDRAWLDTVFAAQEAGRQFNVDQRNTAIARLIGGNEFEGKGGFYGQVAKDIPLNPYSDTLRKSRLDVINDNITRTGENTFNSAEVNLANRGLSSAGTNAQTAAGGINSQLLGQRIGAEQSTGMEQLQFNQMSNEARDSLLAQITSGAANIQANNILDPEAYANTLSGERGIQLSEENQTRMMEYLKTLDPTMAEKLWSLVGPAFAAFMPSSGIGQFIGYGTNALWGR